MNVLFYHSGEYKHCSPNELTENLWAKYISLDKEYIDARFKCVVDFGYPQKMLVTIYDYEGIPYCTMHTDHEDFDVLEYLCQEYVKFGQACFLED